MHQVNLRYSFKEQWATVQQGINKMKEILEISAEPFFHPDEYMKLYTVIYRLICCENRYLGHSPQLYAKYRESFEEYITSVILPSLRNQQAQDIMLIREFVQRWENYKLLGRWLFKIFSRLERHYIPLYPCSSLKKIALDTFRGRVFGEFNWKIRDAVMALIDKEREGEQIDTASLQKVHGILAEINPGDLGFYQQDFEARTIAYYSRKACSWIMENSCLDYMTKTEECLKKERDRISDYMPSSCEQKLMERLQHELLVVHHNQFLEKLQFECIALLRGENYDYLSKLFSVVHDKIPGAREAMANVFKQNIVEEGTAFVQHAVEAAINQNVKEMIVWKLLELRDKYVPIVGGCFMNQELFQSALREGLDITYDKAIAGASVVEVLDTFSDKLKLERFD